MRFIFVLLGLALLTGCATTQPPINGPALATLSDKPRIQVNRPTTTTTQDTDSSKRK